MTVNCSSATFAITAKANSGDWESAHPTGGGGGGGGDDQDSVINGDYDTYLASINPSPTNTFYVATTGTDGAGVSGDTDHPFLTIGYAISRMSGGDRIIVRSGTYTGAGNRISTDQVTIPNGTEGQQTLIMAEEPFTVWITQTTQASAYFDSPISLDTDRTSPGPRQYIHIDGIGVRFLPASATEYENTSSIVRLAGDYCSVTRCIGMSGNGGRFRSFIQYADDSSVGNLVEDCFGVGSFHYAVYGGIGGSGPDTDYSEPCQQHICRRVFIYHTWHAYVSDPSAPFCFYGSDDANLTNTDIGNVLFANCGSFYAADAYSTADNCAWASFLYTPKRVYNVRARGCFSVMGDSTYGLFVADGWAPNSTWVTNDYRGCFGTRNKKTASAGDIATAFFKNASHNGLQRVVNCIVASDNVDALYAGGTYTGDTAGNELRAPSSTRYPMQKNDGTWLDEAIYFVGAVGLKYGETGYDTVNTDRRMWPLPYESNYKTAIEWAAANLERGAHDFPTTVPATGTLCPNIIAGSEDYPYTSLSELVFRSENALAMPDYDTEVYA